MSIVPCKRLTIPYKMVCRRVFLSRPIFVPYPSIQVMIWTNILWSWVTMKWRWGRRHAWRAAVMITSCKCQGLWTCLWRSNKMCASRSWAWRWLRMTGWAIAWIVPWFWWITSLTSHGCIFNGHKHRMGWCILWSKVLSSWGWVRRKLIIKAVHCRWCTTWWIS